MRRTAMDVDADLAQLAPVRNAIVGHALDWGAPVDRSILALLVSEVLANAMEHGSPPIVAAVDWDDRRLRVEISDASDAAPVQRRPDVRDPGGRGIWLVDRNASAWGVDWSPEGKSVWFELRESTRPR